MGELWFWLVGLMFIAWSVLDGFDFGVGILHRVVARTDDERRLVFASIGPVWDCNEVGLIAAGGTTLLAFPGVLAAGFSGLYLPVIFAVWALMTRGASIELRSHLSSPLWRSFFDTTFFLSSLLVPVLMGAALGNVLRGVPLNEQGFFELPLFASWSPNGELGVLDWYTVLCALFVTVTLTTHGANWLVYKTTGEVQTRTLALRPKLFMLTGTLWVLTAVATFFIASPSTNSFWWLGVALSLAGAVVTVLRKSERASFFGSSAFIIGQLVTAFGGLFPVLLRARGNPAFSLTANSAASHGAGLDTALIWWVPGLLLAAGYFWWVLKHFRGKASLD
jgi:cytochrome d ubiquinol oxidase subunit II